MPWRSGGARKVGARDREPHNFERVWQPLAFHQISTARRASDSGDRADWTFLIGFAMKKVLSIVPVDAELPIKSLVRITDCEKS